MSSQEIEDELDMNEIEQILKMQDNKLYQLAQKREYECLQILNKDCFDKIKIYNVPIKYQNYRIQNTNQQNEFQQQNFFQNKSEEKQNQFQQVKKQNSDQLQINENIYQNQQQNLNYNLGWIHTYEAGLENGPIILFLHGYNNTSMSFYKAIKFMQCKYKIFCIDILGMGLSSRPQIQIQNPQQQIDFLVESIQQWRIQMSLQNQDIFLAGHCFGGYIACHYALKYRTNINKLILISPLGMSNFTQQELDNLQKDIYKKSGYFKKKLIDYGQKMFQKQQTPNSIAKKFYVPSNYMLKKFFNKNLNLEKNESILYQKFMKRVMQLPESTEKFLNTLFKLPNLAAKIPLEDIIPLKLRVQNIIPSQQSCLSQSNMSSLVLEEQKLSSTESSRSQLNSIKLQQFQDVNLINKQQRLSTLSQQSVSDKILQQMENQSQLSKKSLQFGSGIKKNKGNSQFLFQIDCYFGTENSIINSQKGWENLLTQYPTIGKIEHFEGGHISILENYELYLNMLKYI